MGKQADDLLHRLRQAGDRGLCVSTYEREHNVGRAAARKRELVVAGYNITKVKCEEHNHVNRQIRYVLIEDDGRLF